MNDNEQDYINKITESIVHKCIQHVLDEDISEITKTFDEVGDNLPYNEITNEPIEETNEPIRQLLKCSNCEFTTTDPICLLDHNMIVHEGAFSGDQYMCDYCEQCFQSEELLNSHIDSDHPDNEDDNDNDETNDNENNDNNNGNEDIQSSCSDSYIVNNEYTMSITPLKVMHRERKSYFTETGEMRNKFEYKLSFDNCIVRTPEKKIKCPMCDQLFETQFYLGEHFTTSHTTFEDQMLLDNNMPETSFPGFELLELLNVISFLTMTQIKKIINKKCTICYHDYTLYNFKKVGQKYDLINSRDLDLLFDDNVFNDESISDTELDVISNNKAKIKIKEKSCDIIQDLKYPIMMACCEAIVCHHCIKKHLMRNELKGLIICPFCTKDHTITNSDYVYIIEPSNIDKQAWIEWWKRNDRINMLAF